MAVFAVGLPYVPPVSALEFDDRSTLVWGEQDDKGGYAIRLSRYLDGQWSEAILLSSGDGYKIHPAVWSDGGGKIWVAWTELHGVRGMIRTTFSANGQWKEPSSLATLTLSDMAPSLAVEADGRLWLVYSGSDGSQDDVYSVYWTGETWSEPIKINSDDEFPDILPQVTIGDDGLPVVSWQGYNGHQYVTFISRWNGHGWSSEQELPSSGKYMRQRSLSSLPPEEQQLLMNSLPDFLANTSQAVLYYYSKGKVESIKLNGLR